MCRGCSWSCSLMRCQKPSSGRLAKVYVLWEKKEKKWCFLSRLMDSRTDRGSNRETEGAMVGQTERQRDMELIRHQNRLGLKRQTLEWLQYGICQDIFYGRGGTFFQLKILTIWSFWFFSPSHPHCTFGLSDFSHHVTHSEHLVFLIFLTPSPTHYQFVIPGAPSEQQSNQKHHQDDQNLLRPLCHR